MPPVVRFETILQQKIIYHVVPVLKLLTVSYAPFVRSAMTMPACLWERNQAKATKRPVR